MVSGNGTYSRGWKDNFISVMMTHCLRRSICDSPLDYHILQWNIYRKYNCIKLIQNLIYSSRNQILKQLPIAIRWRNNLKCQNIIKKWGSFRYYRLRHLLYKIQHRCLYKASNNVKLYITKAQYFIFSPQSLSLILIWLKYLQMDSLYSIMFSSEYIAFLHIMKSNNAEPYNAT